MGARRSYDLGRMLEERGMLSTMITDFAYIEGDRSAKFSSRRVIKGIPKRRVRSYWAPTVVSKPLLRLGIENQWVYSFTDRILGACVRERDIESARFVFNTAGNGGPDLLKKFRSLGKPVFTDIVIDPENMRILLDEHRKWPTFPKQEGLSERSVARYERRIKATFQVTDVVLCATELVKSKLVEIYGVPNDRVVVLPYAIDLGEAPKRIPQRGRVLFVGSSALRKGLPYLAAASDRLSKKNPCITIRVAGDFPASIVNDPAHKHLSFLGKLDHQSLRDEYAKAHAFCLPSLAEGMSRAVLEAMSYGVPVIATLESGAPITHLKSGLVIPPANDLAIADAIEQLTKDDALCERLSSDALKIVKEFNRNNVSRRLARIIVDHVN